MYCHPHLKECLTGIKHSSSHKMMWTYYCYISLKSTFRTFLFEYHKYEKITTRHNLLFMKMFIFVFNACREYDITTKVSQRNSIQSLGLRMKGKYTFSCTSPEQSLNKKIIKNKQKNPLEIVSSTNKTRGSLTDICSCFLFCLRIGKNLGRKNYFIRMWT